MLHIQIKRLIKNLYESGSVLAFLQSHSRQNAHGDSRPGEIAEIPHLDSLSSHRSDDIIYFCPSQTADIVKQNKWQADIIHNIRRSHCGRSSKAAFIHGHRARGSAKVIWPLRVCKTVLWRPPLCGAPPPQRHMKRNHNFEDDTSTDSHPDHLPSN